MTNSPTNEMREAARHITNDARRHRRVELKGQELAALIVSRPLLAGLEGLKALPGSTFQYKCFDEGGGKLLVQVPGLTIEVDDKGIITTSGSIAGSTQEPTDDPQAVIDFVSKKATATGVITSPQQRPSAAAQSARPSPG